jgi:GDP-L-fucose synthase
LKTDAFFKNKKVLVTGGAGFVGSNLLAKLLLTGAKISATIHKKNPQIKDKRIKFMKGDLTDKGFCKKIVSDIDYVFMCGANTSGAAVIEKTPLVHVTPNVIMNTLMLEAAYKAGVSKFLFISSNAVYPVVDYPVKESEMMQGDPFEKYFPVAWMKRFSEILCEIYATKIKNPMKVIVVRPANSYGPYDDFEWETSHVVPSLIRKVVERQNPIEVWGDGRDIKDLIYVEDLVEGLLLSIFKIDNYTALNIGTGRGVSIREVLAHILELDNYSDAKIVFKCDKPTMIPKRILDVHLAKKLLGFKTRTSLSDGLKKTISWHKRACISRKLEI